MIKFIFPSSEYMESYKSAILEYKENNVTEYQFIELSDNIFGMFEDYRNDRNLKPGYVGADYYWLVDSDSNRFIGEISIRHDLTEALLKYGGNIDYWVRYSEWKKGYGTLMLQKALEKSKELGFERVLITCDDDNYGSIKVIENNGGVLENKVQNIIDGKEIITRRYWIEL